MIDYPARLKLARERMAEKNIGLMILPPAANLWYLTGVRRQEEGGTDHNRYGDWMLGGYIGLQGGITFVVPRMGGGFFRSEAQGKPWFDAVRTVNESESPFEILKVVLSRFDLHGKKVAVDDRSWAQQMLALRKLLPDTEFVLASEVLMPLRMIKSEVELDLMRKAGAITEQAFEKAMTRLKPGVTRIEMESEINYQFKALGAEHMSFVTAVYISGNMPGTGQSDLPRLKHGDSVMFDMGCVYEGYCSDFGRTAFCGEPSAEYRKVHETVLASQQAGMAAMKAGQATGAQVNAIARKVIADAGYDEYFTHRLGHGIGITVHEPPWLDVIEQTVLQQNMTFTVEPSIMAAGRFGNRVEDVIVVTDHGGVSLYNADHRLYVVG